MNVFSHRLLLLNLFHTTNLKLGTASLATCHTPWLHHHRDHRIISLCFALVGIIQLPVCCTRSTNLLNNEVYISLPSVNNELSITTSGRLGVILR
jgi:hypothetical protein